MSKEALPYLKVTGPDGVSFDLDIPHGGPLLIGRTVLKSDPHVSRAHCTVEYADGQLLVTDNKSKNGTLVFHRGEWCWLRDHGVRLQDGEVIRINGGLPETDGGAELIGFWDLVFRDPFATQAVDFGPASRRLEFDPECEKFFVVEAGRRQELALSAGSQEHRLLRYMQLRSQASHQSNVDCSHEELMTAIWDGPERHARTRNDIAHLVRELRLRLEPNPATPRFLITVRGGYRLVTRPLPDLEQLGA